jgi:outer membrane immunogenic protein
MCRSIVAFLGAIALSVATAQAASASDLPTKTSVYKAPQVSNNNWTGCYVGANLGVSGSRDLWEDHTGPVVNSEQVPVRANGVVGGGQIGCDYQSGLWVFGVEGMFDRTDMTGITPDPETPTVLFHDNIRWLATTTARIGYVVDRSLLYVKGGAAWMNTESFFTGASTGSNTRTADGWVIGAGLEYGIAANWSVKVEYEHIGSGETRRSTIVDGGPRDLGWTQSVDVVLVGVNYRFDSLTFAKY